MRTLLFAAIGTRVSAQDSISIDGMGVRNTSLIVVVRRNTLQEGARDRRCHLPPVAGEGPHRHPPIRVSEAYVKIQCDEPAR